MITSIYCYNILLKPISNNIPASTISTSIPVNTIIPSPIIPIITVTYNQIPTQTIIPNLIQFNNPETEFIIRSFNYTLQGKSDIITINLYKNINDKILKQQSLQVACWRYENDNSPCNTSETQQYYLTFINNSLQKNYLTTLINLIKFKTNNKDDQARIAINLVQKIPYDIHSTNIPRSPYNVLYDNMGDCDDKSILLVYILKELGYGTVIFSFSKENHITVGIKSQNQYSYQNSGYAFIETTITSIITDSQKDYGNGKLNSTPEILHISDGIQFSNILSDYSDATLYDNFINNEEKTLSPSKYREWEILMWKYGFTYNNGTIIYKEDPSLKPLCDGERLCNNQCWEKCTYGFWSCTPKGVICL